MVEGGFDIVCLSVGDLDKGVARQYSAGKNEVETCHNLNQHHVPKVTVSLSQA